MVRTAAASRRRGAVEATRANPRRSARQPKAKEPSPTPAPVPKAKQAPKAVASTSKKPAQAPRKRQKKEEPPAPPEEPVQTEEEAAALARAKVAWAKTRGRRGHLKMVIEMPFDLLLEVFGFLQPADLLHLSMTTKAMRSLVMDKSLALPLWKAAFDRVEPQPPACPEGLSLPQWANFLYARTCNNCNATTGLERAWGVLVTLCKKCMLAEFSQKIYYSRDSSDLHSMLRELVTQKYLKRPGEYGRQTYFYRPDYEKHKAAIMKLGKDKAKIREYVDKEKQKNYLRGNLQWGGGGSSWEYKMRISKAADVDARRTGREQALLDRLDALGYTPVITRLPRHSRSTLPGFGGVKPLTDKEWNKLGPLLVDTLEELQKTFKGQDWKKMINSRTNTMVWVYLYYICQHRDKEPYAPQKRSLAFVEPFRTMIYDTDPETEVEQKDFFKHLEEFPQILDAWREEADDVLIGLLPHSEEAGSKKSKKGKAKAIAPDRSVLKLGTTIFTCKWCPEALTYPAVLSHTCLYRSPARNRTNEEKEAEGSTNEEAGEDEGMEDPNFFWNVGQNQVWFDEAASACAAAVIKVLGEDPTTATWEELDTVNKRVECVRCRKDKGLKRLVMDWRNAILHEFDKHGEGEDENSDVAKWELLDDESLAIAYEKEKSVKKNSNVRPVEQTKRCCECEKLVLDENGKASFGRWGYAAPAPGATTCPKGHDLTLEGAMYDTAWAIPFKSTPYPVKIA